MSLATSPNGQADLLVLCYHAVDETWPAALSVTPSAFRRQLDFLVERGYEAATFTEAVMEPPRRKTVVITFDDGFRSVVDEAFPLLRERGLVATLFVPTQLVDDRRPASWEGVTQWLGTPHERKMLPVSHAELLELAGAGWEIGSHTCTHPHLTQLADSELAWELTESRRRCGELLGRSCESLAYPYGDVDERVVRAAAEAGYRAACTLPARLDAASPLAWPRVGIWHDDSPRVFALKVSPALRKVRRSALWNVLDGARRLPARARA